MRYLFFLFASVLLLIFPPYLKSKSLPQTRLKLLILLLLVYNTSTFAQWELRFPDQLTTSISDIYFSDQLNGYAVRYEGQILKTTDGGMNWKLIKHYSRQILSEIEFVSHQTGFILSPISFAQDNIDLIYTNDGGDNWQTINCGIGRATAFLPLSDSVIIQGSDWSQILRTQGSFFDWTQTYIMPYYYNGFEFVPYGHIKDFEKLNSGRLLALGSSEIAFMGGVISDSVVFILYSDDNAYSWDTLWCNLPKVLNTFTFYDDNYGWMGGEDNEIYKSTDAGLSWQKVYSDSGYTSDERISKIAVLNPSKALAVSTLGKVISTTNGGITWSTLSLPIAEYPYKIYFINDDVGFISGPELMITTDGGTTWNKVDNEEKPQFLKLQFLNTQLGFGISPGNINASSFYRTDDGGWTWMKLYTGTAGSSFNGFFMKDSLRGWLTEFNKLYKTTDGGITWTEVFVDNNLTLIRGVEFFNETMGILFDVTRASENFNYLTTNGGNTWEGFRISNDPYVTSYLKIRFTDPSHLWFVDQQGVWLSRDSSKTWSLISSQTNTIAAFDFLDSLNGWVAHLDAFQNKVKYTTDGGTTWTTTLKPYWAQSSDLVIEGRDLEGKLKVTVAGIDGSIFSFREGDPSGIQEPSFTNSVLNSIAVYREGNTIHKWIGGGVVLYKNNYITSVEAENTSPAAFDLLNNYPNPFNPATTIKYTVPVRSAVTIKIFDILGNEIETLVNEEKPSGSYEVTWNAGYIPSGVYFYQLKAGSFIKTNKMMLIR